ncbi:extracellular solute-binding protein [Arthrobacter subterraneus]|uniref:extracellular solute-binding protein n=2 Tax=Arthrobacter TaxID=1663 RepID=UPI003818C24B
MKTSRTAAGFAAATAIALTATACGGGGGGTADTAEAVDYGADLSGTLTTGGFTLGDEVATSRADLATAALEEDGVTVEINESNFDPQRFAAQAASGTLPDLVVMDRQYVATYAAKGLIEPVDDCFTTHDVNAEEHYYPAVLQDVTYNDQVYGIPQFWQPWSIITNTRVMEEAGVTAEDLDTSNPEAVLGAAEKMYESEGDTPTRLGFDPQMPSQAPVWFAAFGGKIMDETGKPTLDDPANIEALTWLKDIYDAQGGYETAYSFGQTWDFFGENNQFVADQVGAGLYAQWYPNVLSDFADQLEISGVPLRNQDGDAIAVAGGQSYVIPTGAKNKAAACKWAVTNTSDEAWMAAAEARVSGMEEGGIFTGIFTGSQTADQMIKDEYLESTGNEGFDQLIDSYYQALENGVPLGSSPAGLEIQTELQNAMAPAMSGDKTIEEALGDAQAAAMLVYEQATAGAQ